MNSIDHGTGAPVTGALDASARVPWLQMESTGALECIGGCRAQSWSSLAVARLCEEASGAGAGADGVWRLSYDGPWDRLGGRDAHGCGDPSTGAMGMCCI